VLYLGRNQLGQPLHKSTAGLSIRLAANCGQYCVSEIFEQKTTMRLEEIKAYWEDSGTRFPLDGQVTPTSRDPYLGELERDNILTHLAPAFQCLEVGCGDGSHTLHYARRVARLRAVDVAASLIQVARQRLQGCGVENVQFSVGSVLDVMDLFPKEQFQCVISQRCLINLPTQQDQERAIKGIWQSLADDGLFLLTEGFQENLDNLNALRVRFSLPEIKVVAYNRNLRLGDFLPLVRQYFDVLETRHYGPYLVLSRVFHPLAVAPEAPKHDSRLNKAAMDLARALPLQELEQYSYNLFFALRKRPRHC
jgi:ubiquinone/menaquinone biosynthesis C-methylase UbiE